MGALITCDVEGCERYYRVYGRAIGPEHEAKRNGWTIAIEAYKDKEKYNGIHFCPEHGDWVKFELSTCQTPRCNAETIHGHHDGGWPLLPRRDND